MITLLYLVLTAVFTGVIYLTYLAATALKDNEELIDANIALMKSLENLHVAVDLVLEEDGQYGCETRNKILLKYYTSMYEK